MRRRSVGSEKLTVRSSHSVQRNGHAIDLSPKEFALLEFLMRHAGQPVTRSAIIEQVWKLNFDTMTNVVDVYINYLRRKVDTGYDRALIRTVRGVGYQIGGSSATSRSAVQAATAPIWPHQTFDRSFWQRETVAALSERAGFTRKSTRTKANMRSHWILTRPYTACAKPCGTAIPGCALKSYATASFTNTRIPAIFVTNSPGIP